MSKMMFPDESKKICAEALKVTKPTRQSKNENLRLRKRRSIIIYLFIYFYLFIYLFIYSTRPYPGQSTGRTEKVMYMSSETSKVIKDQNKVIKPVRHSATKGVGGHGASESKDGPAHTTLAMEKKKNKEENKTMQT